MESELFFLSSIFEKFDNRARRAEIVDTNMYFLSFIMNLISLLFIAGIESVS